MIDSSQMLKHIKTNLPIVCVEKFIKGKNGQIIDWGIRQNKIPDTWKNSQGEGVRVLVIDTGHPFHNDISDNSIIGENFVNDEVNEDLNGHQTHCTGIICAKNNKFGMVGVAPMSKCISVKALNKRGSGTFSSLLKALDYAIKIQPDIISMSLGSTTYSSLIHSKIKQLYDMGIPVVCAAGNSGNSGVNYPAALPETIAVASYNEAGNISTFSSKGQQIDWAAPGEKIYSTYLNNNYSILSGTSMACPFVVGIIALMLSKHKKQEDKTGENDCKSVEQIKKHLLKYTLDKGVLGKDNSWGYGIINIHKLIEDQPKGDRPNQPEPPGPPQKPEKKPVEAPEKGFLKKNIAWVLCGIFLCISLVLAILLLMENSNNINIPYIDENGNVDWDKKMEEEINERKPMD